MKGHFLQGFWLIGVAALAALAAWISTDPYAQAQAKQDLKNMTQSGAIAKSGRRTGPSKVIFPAQNMQINAQHERHVAARVACTTCHVGATTSGRASDRLLPRGQTCDRCHGMNHHNLSEKPQLSGEGRGGDEQRTKESGGNDTDDGNTAVGGAADRDRDGNGGGGGVDRVEAPQVTCGGCHVGYDDAKGDGKVALYRASDSRIRFSHRLHARRNIGCGQCHGAVQEVEQAGRDHLPTMRGCLRCHGLPDSSRGDAKAGCSTCHLTLASGQIRTSFSNGKLFPPMWLGGAHHGADFARTHGKVAGQDSQLCAQCHTEASCAVCHDGRVRPHNVHPNDYLSMHAIEAKQSAKSCASCHRSESFCLPCHMRAGVSWTGPLTAQSRRGRVHPDARQFVHGPMTGAHHGVQARRNLMSCVGCHTQRDCASCHATRAGGGMGVNPHPVGFSSRCRAALVRNGRSCAVCHDAGDAVFSRCR